MISYLNQPLWPQRKMSWGQDKQAGKLQRRASFFFLDYVSENVEKRCGETNVMYLVWPQRHRVCVCVSWWRQGVGEWSIYSNQKKKTGGRWKCLQSVPRKLNKQDINYKINWIQIFCLTFLNVIYISSIKICHVFI